MQVFRTQIDCDCSLKIVITESTHLKKMESEITLTKVVRNFEYILEYIHTVKGRHHARCFTAFGLSFLLPIRNRKNQYFFVCWDEQYGFFSF